MRHLVHFFLDLEGYISDNTRSTLDPFAVLLIVVRKRKCACRIFRHAQGNLEMEKGLFEHDFGVALCGSGSPSFRNEAPIVEWLRIDFFLSGYFSAQVFAHLIIGGPDHT